MTEPPSITQAKPSNFARVLSLHHVAVHVADLETSVAFYEAVFGLTVAGRLSLGREQIVFLAGPRSADHPRPPDRGAHPVLPGSGRRTHRTVGAAKRGVVLTQSRQNVRDDSACVRHADFDPRQTLRDGYDRIAARYARWVADGPADTTAAQHLQDLVNHLPPAAHVLDLGCGGGDRWSARTGAFTLTGVDLSLQQLRRAREVLPNARLIQADMTRLELPLAAFDAVVSLYAFNHLPFGELPNVLTRIARWLKPGGLLVANMGASYNPGTFEADWLGARMYFSGYAVDSSQRFISAAGLQIQSAREETLWETTDGRTTPMRFLWIVAQRPVG